MRIIKGLSLIFLVAACIRDVDPNTIINNQKKLVIFSFINTNDTLIGAQVSLLNDFYNISTNYNPHQNYISNAVVTIDNGVKYIELTYNPLQNRYLASSNTFPIEEGKTYNLTVKYGSITATANCTVPINDGLYSPLLKYKDSSEVYSNSDGDTMYYNSIKGIFTSKLNSYNRFHVFATGCGNYTDRKNSTYYTCNGFFGSNNPNYYTISVIPDSTLTFLESDIPKYSSIEIDIQLLDDPFYYNQQYNSGYHSYDPLGEPTSSYSNFTNAFGVFGSSSTRKIILTF